MACALGWGQRNLDRANRVMPKKWKGLFFWFRGSQLCPKNNMNLPCDQKQWAAPLLFASLDLEGNTSHLPAIILAMQLLSRLLTQSK